LDDPIAIDKTIARAAAALRAWRRRLRSEAGGADDPWFEGTRHVTTRAAFRWACDLPESDPLREPFRRWIYVLAVSRIAEPAIVAVERLRQTRDIEIDRPEAMVASVRDVVGRAIAEPAAARAEQWFDALGDRTGALRSAESDLASAREEIASRLGVADPSEMQAACSRNAILLEARDLLGRTDDLARAVFEPVETLAGLLPILIAREVPGTWPARLSGRWLGDLFRTTTLADGLSIDLGPLPRTIGASSFVRGLARFGAAYARAASDRAGPFVLSNDATDSHALRRGALFAMLLVDPVFLTKKLGFSKEASGSVARALGRTLLGAVRLEAVRSTVDFARASNAEVADAVERAWCVRTRPALSAVLPRARLDAPSRLVGVLLAAIDRDQLVARFDEDWFDNPRAAAWLRERDAVLRPAALPDLDLSQSARRLAARAEALLA
jgi:hypothetical protein